MVDYTDVFIRNLPLGVALVSFFYAIRYFPFTANTTLEDTRQVSDKARSAADDLGTRVRNVFNEFVAQVNNPNQTRGTQPMLERVALNRVRSEQGLPADPKVFVQRDEEDLKLRLGVMFFNGNSMMQHDNGFLLEVVSQSMYNGLVGLDKAEI